MFLNTDRPRSWRLADSALTRLFSASKADRWGLSRDTFARQLEESARRAFAGETPEARRLERYAESLHLEDLALACACAEGHETAWDHFVREFRPVLYRAADAIDPSGGAREVADALYGDLFGLRTQDGARQSHFRYFHGRSNLSTWLRAVLAQRYVDRIRRDRRSAPLPDDEDAHPLSAPAASEEPAFGRYFATISRVLTAVVAALAPRDRLRLRYYYAQELTLAQIGTLLGEHEATVSRNLARTRRSVREGIEAALRDREGMSEAEISDCFAAVARDSGPLDMADMLGADEPDETRDDRKKTAPRRSN